MSGHDDPPRPEPPSTRTLAITTAIALLVAIAILVTVVLPAEYGVDPLGTGAALGLVVLSAPEAVGPPPGATAITPVQQGPVAHYADEYKVDSTELTLGPYEFVEYKYRLERGASMLYSWTASSTLVHEFHGDPDDNPSQPQTYDKSDKRQGTGSFSAPFSGIHGWYWENPGGNTITVTVTSAGFYSFALEFRSDGTRRRHDVTDASADGP